MKENLLILFFALLSIAAKSQSISELESKAEAGDVTSMEALGYRYYNGVNVSQNYEMALKFWLKAAYTGKCQVGVSHNIAIMYQYGRGTEKNIDKAIYWYEKAVNHGIDVSMYNLGWIYENERGYQDYRKAAYWYEKAASKDHPTALNNLGLLYKNGNGLSQDYSKAAELFEKAIDKGSPEALVNLGAMYHDGTGVPQNYQKAAALFERAAGLGHDMSFYLLGIMYLYGRGVDVNYQKALELFSKSLSVNNDLKTRIAIPIAQARLGEQYYKSKDYSKAVPLIKAAAESKSNPQGSAMRLLAACYRYGIGGLPIDNDKEQYWMQKAERFRDRAASNILDKTE